MSEGKLEWHFMNLLRPMYWLGGFMTAAIVAFALSLVWPPLSYAFFVVWPAMMVVGLLIDYDA